MPSTGSRLKDRGAGMEPTIPQDQTLLKDSSLQEQTCPCVLGLSTGTDFHVTNQMRPTFDQEQQTRLRKGATRDLIITAVAEGFPIVWRVCYRLHSPIQGKQAHPFPEGLRGRLRQSFI